MRRKKSFVNHWRYDNGWHNIPGILKNLDNTRSEKEFLEESVGWHCWFYEADDIDISKWMSENMTGEYDCSFRFNSGDPMHTILIKSDMDATLFKLTWI